MQNRKRSSISSKTSSPNIASGRYRHGVTDDLWGQTATALAVRIRTREISAAEVMRAHLARIEAVNPDLNAIVTLDREGALAAADAADRQLAAGEEVGP